LLLLGETVYTFVTGVKEQYTIINSRVQKNLLFNEDQYSRYYCAGARFTDNVLRFYHMIYAMTKVM